METINSSSFSEGNWSGGRLPDQLIIQPIDPVEGRALAETLENWFSSHGLRGSTGPDSSDTAHQNLVGIEGWMLDFVKGEFTRLDDFTLRWNASGLASALKNRERISSPPETVKVASLTQLREALSRKGELHGKRFGL